MADTAVFSSFHRPWPMPPSDDSPVELPAAAAGATSKQPTAVPEPALAEQTSEIRLDRVANSTEQLPGSVESVAVQPRRNAWSVSRVEVGSDQLGLAHPDVIALRAKLLNAPAILLDANPAGIYRPPGFRPAPWSGFAYDQLGSVSTGLAAGTRILTARGEVEVENLVPGDAAMALRGPALLPISWIGRKAAASPTILIEPNALGPDVPRRLLCIGTDQAVFLNPDPVAAHTLVNGTTIRIAENDPADLFQIDVGRAEIILAEGLAISSSHGVGTRR